MKSIKRISILMVLLFAVVVILTAKIETPVDGNDVYGFPSTFLTIYGDRLAENGFKTSSFNFLHLIIDLFLVTIAALVIERVIAAIIKKFKEKNATRASM